MTELKKIVAELDAVENGNEDADALVPLRPRIDALRVKAITPSGFYGPQTILKIYDTVCRYNALLTAFEKGEPLPVDGFDAVVDEKMAGQLQRRMSASNNDSPGEDSLKKQRLNEEDRDASAASSSSCGYPPASRGQSEQGRAGASSSSLGGRHPKPAGDDVEMLDTAAAARASSAEASQREFITPPAGANAAAESDGGTSANVANIPEEFLFESPLEEVVREEVNGPSVFRYVDTLIQKTGVLSDTPNFQEQSSSFQKVVYSTRSRQKVEISYLYLGGDTVVLYCGSYELTKLCLADPAMSTWESIHRRVMDAVVYPCVYGLVVPRFENLPGDSLDIVASFLNVKELGRLEKASRLVHQQLSVAPFLDNHVWYNVHHNNVVQYLPSDSVVRKFAERAEMKHDIEPLLALRPEGATDEQGNPIQQPPRFWKNACRRTTGQLSAIRRTREQQDERRRRERDERARQDEENRRPRDPGQRGPPGRGGPQPVPPPGRGDPGIWYDPVHPGDVPNRPLGPDGGAFPFPGGRGIGPDGTGRPDPNRPGWNPDLDGPVDPRRPLLVEDPRGGARARNPNAERDLFGAFGIGRGPQRPGGPGGAGGLGGEEDLMFGGGGGPKGKGKGKRDRDPFGGGPNPLADPRFGGPRGGGGFGGGGFGGGFGW